MDTPGVRAPGFVAAPGRRFELKDRATITRAAGSSLDAPRRSRYRLGNRRTWRAVASGSPDSKSAHAPPPWAGQGALSQLVNALISFPPLFSFMKQAARQVLISTADKNGVEWTRHVERLEQALPPEERESVLKRISSSSVEYPAYYLRQFHAYEEGNLGWRPAFEAEPATRCVGLRVWKKEKGLTWQTATSRVRTTHLDAIFERAPFNFGMAESFSVLDVGCGVGISTRCIEDRLLKLRGSERSGLEITGFDASPYMLAVAELEHSSQNIRYEHGLAEECGRENGSVDWFSVQFMIHELPSAAIRAVFAEAYRVLKPGGVLSLIDNDPASPVIRNLPPPLFTLMKSTEPHSDEYYAFDVATCLRDLGFYQVSSDLTDPRHRTVVAVKKPM